MGLLHLWADRMRLDSCLGRRRTQPQIVDASSERRGESHPSRYAVGTDPDITTGVGLRWSVCGEHVGLRDVTNVSSDVPK